MLYKKRKHIFVLLLILIFVVTGCQQGGRVKGIKEKGKLEAEPDITVKLPDGQQKSMKLEEYVTAVVAGEMKKNWPENTYGAQAILARSFALKYMEENETDVISSSFQSAQEYKPENVNKAISNAVDKTRGKVALYKDQYIKGWFHASAGGQTTTAKVGLAFEESEPRYVKSVKSPDQEAPADIKNWRVSFTKTEIEKTLNRMGKGVGDLRDISIVDRDKTGRVIEFNFKGANKSTTVKAANFRKELDPKKLKSTKIEDLKKEDGGYVFTGSGFGHGVGMSQWGAYSLAKNDNKTPEEIVEHYFEDIYIKKMYD